MVLEREEREEREREIEREIVVRKKHQLFASHTLLDRGLNLQCKYVP